MEGLPPNNATHLLRITLDQARARAVADMLVESFEPTEVAASAFEIDEAGKDWVVEVYFGFTPDLENVRDLVSLAAGEAAAHQIQLTQIEKQDWVAKSLAGLKPVRAGRFLVHGAHDRNHLAPYDVGVEIEAGLAFGTGHHGTTRGCLLHFDRLLKRRRPQRVLDVGCGAGILAIAAAKVLKRQVWLGDIDPVAVAVANANASLNGVAPWCRALVSRGVEKATLRQGAPYDLVFANILAKPLRLLSPSLAKVIAPHGEAIVSGLLLTDVPSVLSAWRDQGFFLQDQLTLEGWASLRLRR